jgi:O-antigen/teichoic acid export membrane protein
MFKNIDNKPFLQNFSKLFVGSVAAQILATLSPFIITYFYAPEEFGKLTIAISVISLFSGLVTLRHEALTVITESELESKNLFITAMTLSLIICGAILILLLFTKIIFSDLVPTYYLLVPVGIFSFATFTTTREYLFRKSKFGTDAKTNVARNLMIVTLQVLGGFLRPYASSLLIAKFIGELIAVILNISALQLLKRPFNLYITKITIPKYWKDTSSLIFTKILQSISGHGVNYIWAVFWT